MLSIAFKVLFRRGEEHEELPFSEEIRENLSRSGMRCFYMRGVSFTCVGEKSVVILRRSSPIAVRGVPEADTIIIRVMCEGSPPNECIAPIADVVYGVAEKFDKPVIPL